MTPPLTRLADSLPSTVPFVGVDTHERRLGRPFAARLGANENGFGPSPKVIEAMSQAAPGMWMYGDGDSHDLVEALSAHTGVSRDRIIIGEGIDGLLGLAVRLFVEPGSRVVSSTGAYPTFNYHVAGFGGRLATVPYRDYREDLDALLEAARAEPTSMVYLSNPDNPMGTWWPAGEVEAFARALPAETMLILDEAYGEFAPAGTLPPPGFVPPNVLRMRTFSKAYGLAGLRCGYALGAPEVISAFDKVRNHFGVSRMAQAASLAALADQPYLRETLQNVADARRRIAEIASDNGLSALPSATNFVAIDCGRDGTFAQTVLTELARLGIFVRKPMAPGLDQFIRVSSGPAGELDLFAKALPKALDAAAG